MRKYENLSCLHENRLKQRAYYIPENEGAYTLLNGFVSYKVNANLSLFLNCNNITDCVYYSRVGGNGDFFGDPRNFTLSARCSF